MDEVLLKIHRIYGKEESTAALFKRISELEYEVGILKSEKSELEFLKSAEKIADLKKMLKDNQAANHINKKNMLEWQNKYFKLFNQCNGCTSKIQTNGNNIRIEEYNANIV